jgi:hypothetical protein
MYFLVWSCVRARVVLTSWLCLIFRFTIRGNSGSVSVALSIQHATRMRCVVLSSVACLAAPYFSTLSHIWHDFRKKLLNIKCVCVWIFCTTFAQISLILRRINQIVSYTYVGLHVKYPLFLSDYNETWIFMTCFRKMPRCQIPWKSILWEPSCFMRTDRQT